MSSTPSHRELNRAYTSGTDANDTIIWQGSAGYWVFKQGGTVFAQTAGNAPLGPIVNAQLGAEMEALNTYDQQNSFYDYNAGRIQSNVYYTTWANPPIYEHDVPPYDPSFTHGDTWLNDRNPSAFGGGGC